MFTLMQTSLQLLNDATHFFSRLTPNLAKVIPVMDIISDHFTSMANDNSLLPTIRTAIGTAKHTLNWYYSQTDNPEGYRITMNKRPPISKFVY
jgi:hypothetical protein